MLYRIDHETRLTYSEPVIESVIEVRMAPPSTDDQSVLGYRLTTSPNATVTTYRDGFGNRVELFSILPPHPEVVIRSRSFVQLHRRSGAERLGTLIWPGERPVDLEAAEFLHPSPLADWREPSLAPLLSGLPQPSGSLAEVAEGLWRAIRGLLAYERKHEAAYAPPGEALSRGRGNCQDFSHLFIAAARAWGWPARCVSGYVHSPTGGELATHAWVQVWGGKAVGWVDLDPTQGKWVEKHHIVVAVGRDCADVPPNRGVWKGSAQERIAVTVSVQPTDRVPPEASGQSVPAPVWMVSQVQQQQMRPRRLQYQRSGLFRQQQSQQQQANLPE